MNNVYENNMRFLPILKFWDKYKKIISLLVLTLIGLITFFIINKQINKYQSEQAALIYNDWQTELLSEEPNIENLNSLLDEFLNSYKKTGYTQLALLEKANLDAKLKNYDEALYNFNELIMLTDGARDNKIFNKISRVSASRILLSLERYDEALSMIEKYSLGDTNAPIHELAGDILFKQGKVNLAINQYEAAEEKYTDQTSKSIISMKIASISN
jgi:predicted negative regulator of RcsB-dependent stress response|tara:strand:- start:1567 stop:2211 length:645 start_codon:yes stop_codon:yes gene_type:complete